MSATIIHLAVVQHAKDNRPQETEAAWEDFAFSISQVRKAECTVATCQGKECPYKDGMGWMPVRLRGNRRRCNADVGAITAAVFDIDYPEPIQFGECRARIKAAGVAHVIYPTHNYRPEAPRYRLVMPLSREVLPAEWPAVWTRLVEKFAIQADPAAKDLSRFYYLPSIPGDVDAAAEVLS